MKRLFGTKKEVKAAPTLAEAASGVEGRVDALDLKIKKIDAELRVHKEKLKTCKGSAKQLATKRAMACLQKKRSVGRSTRRTSCSRASFRCGALRCDAQHCSTNSIF